MLRRRSLMNTEERWDYIALPDANGYCYLENYIKPPAIQYGSIVTIEWSGVASGFDGTWAYVWSGWDLGMINVDTETNMNSLRQSAAPQHGRYTLRITYRSNPRGLSIGRYNSSKEINQSFKGDYIKVRID